MVPLFYIRHISILVFLKLWSSLNWQDSVCKVYKYIKNISLFSVKLALGRMLALKFVKHFRLTMAISDHFKDFPPLTILSLVGRFSALQTFPSFNFCSPRKPFFFPFFKKKLSRSKAMTSILYFIFKQVWDKTDKEIISYDVFLMTVLKYYGTCGIYSAPRPDAGRGNHTRDRLFLCLPFDIAKAFKNTCLCVGAGEQTRTYSRAVRAWRDNKRFALSYCVHPELLCGNVDPSVSDKWRMGSKCQNGASFQSRTLGNMPVVS